MRKIKIDGHKLNVKLLDLLLLYNKLYTILLNDYC